MRTESLDPSNRAIPAPWPAIAIAVAAWLTVTVSSLALRPLIPIDETRYLSVAWEMWWRGDFLVPYLNGEPYSDKPPLLFWLINLTWLATGVSETAARALPAVFTIGSAGLAAWLGWLLWPDRREVASVAPLILLGSTAYALYGTLVRFDILLGCFVLLGLCAVVKVARTADWRWWVLFSAALAAGVLTKGPVVCVYLLPAALLAPLWIPRPERPPWRAWYMGAAVAVAAGSVLALAWALPAASAGGTEYASKILWQQTAGRVTASFAHANPWWFYLALLPVLLYPWLLVPAVWRGRQLIAAADGGVRFCLIWIVAGLLLLTAISGKQVHYLLPLAPAFALVVARAISGLRTSVRAVDVLLPAALPVVLGLVLLLAPVSIAETLSGARVPAWIRDLPDAGGFTLVVGTIVLSAVTHRRVANTLLATAAGSALVLVTANAVGSVSIFHLFDLTEASRYLGDHQDAPIAYNKGYEGEFGFLGRLTRPIVPVYEDDMKAWLEQHRGARVVVRHASPPDYVSGEPLFEQVYRGHRLGIWLAPGRVTGDAPPAKGG